ncbi:hypothetical protein MUP79_08390 [Candidatus Bathyarchaeota archaeon]|nr:hypothetical protein [Candidatus Bathyarchaeota archaeon]
MKNGPDTLGVFLAVVGAILILAAIFAPSTSTQIIFKPLALVTEVSPNRVVITGTDTDAAVLEFAIGVALLIAGLMRLK